MALSKDEKDALNEHFRDKDIYDPTKDPEQEVSTFEPKGLFAGGQMGAFCEGGSTGYANGGDVGPGDQSGYAADSGAIDAPEGAYITQDQAKQQAEANLASKANSDPMAQIAFDKAAQPPPPPLNAPTMPQEAPPIPNLSIDQERAAFGAPAAPQADSGKLAPDQMADLYKALSAKPSLGQSAFSGLAGLADAIETGVARAGNPGFQKNISEQQQNQKQNLIAALSAKYKGAELGQGQQRIGQEGKRIENEAAHNKATEQEAKDALAAENLRASQSLGAAQTKEAREAAQVQRENDMKIVQEYSPLKPGGYTPAQRDAAAARLKAGGASATPLTATNKMGHKIVSVDGGKTWKPMQ